MFAFAGNMSFIMACQNPLFPTPLPMETLEIARWKSITTDNLTVTNLWGGHKILRGETGGRAGDLPFTNIELKMGGETVSQMVYHPESDKPDDVDELSFGSYIIRILAVGWNGATVRCTVENMYHAIPDADVVAPNALEGLPAEVTSFEWRTIVLKAGESNEYRSIRITHDGGAQKIAFDGSDPSYVNLILQNIDGDTSENFRTQYENTTGSPEVDIRYHGYLIRITKITPGAAEVTMVVREDSDE